MDIVPEATREVLANGSLWGDRGQSATTELSRLLRSGLFLVWMIFFHCGGKRGLHATKRTASPKLTLLLDHLMRAGQCRGSRLPLPLAPHRPSDFRQIISHIEQRLIHKR